MSKKLFHEKYQTKTNSELEGISQDSKRYVLEARKAAIDILKSRNIASQTIYLVENEIRVQKNLKEEASKSSAHHAKTIIQKLNEIHLRSTRKYKLKNGNELEIYRVNKAYFQVRIKAFRSELAPVMICKVIDRTTFKTFPFLYLKGFLMFGIGGTAIAFILYLFDLVKPSAILMPIIISLGFQALLLPLYFVILKFFKRTLS